MVECREGEGLLESLVDLVDSVVDSVGPLMDLVDTVVDLMDMGSLEKGAGWGSW